MEIIRLHGELRTAAEAGKKNTKKNVQHKGNDNNDFNKCFMTDLSIDGGHGQLHVAMGDVGLAVVEATAAEELLSYSGERPIAADDQISLDLLIQPVRPGRGRSS